MPRLSRSLGLTALMLGTLTAAAQEGAVVREISPERTEEILTKHGVKDFRKTASPKGKGELWYDYKQGGFSIRLYWFQGKDLMLDCIFDAVPLETVNLWNSRAKFSRCNLQKGEKGAFTALESNLDLLGGVTEGTVLHFLDNFQEELRNFQTFLIERIPVQEEVVHRKFPEESLDALLKNLKIEYEKKNLGAAVLYFFGRRGHRVQLTSLGGTDLVLSASFPPLPLEKVNRYNHDRKFIRVANVSVKDQQVTSLQANLDCTGGVTESIVRHFLLVFGDEVEAFERYAGKKGE